MDFALFRAISLSRLKIIAIMEALWHNSAKLLKNSKIAKSAKEKQRELAIRMYREVRLSDRTTM